MCMIPAGPTSDTTGRVWQYAGFCAALVCSFVVFPTDLLASLVTHPHRKVQSWSPALLCLTFSRVRAHLASLAAGAVSWRLPGALPPGVRMPGRVVVCTATQLPLRLPSMKGGVDGLCVIRHRTRPRNGLLASALRLGSSKPGKALAPAEPRTHASQLCGCSLHGQNRASAESQSL